MPGFVCLVSDKTGAKKKINRTAESEELLYRQIRKEGLVLLSVNRLESQSKGFRFGTGELVRFFGSLNLMVSAGLTIRESLESLLMTDPAARERQVYEMILESLDKGDSFQSAFETPFRRLPVVVPALLAIGEKTGGLKEVLPRICDYLERKKKVREQIIASITYPLIVLVLVVVGIFLFALYGIPFLEDFLNAVNTSGSSGIESVITQLFSLRVVLLGATLIVTILSLLFALLGKVSPGFVHMRDRILLGIPLVKSFVVDNEMFNLFFSLEVLVAGGIPFKEGLMEASRIIDNTVLRESVNIIRNDIIKGSSLSEAFEKRRDFPRFISQWFRLGEKTGAPESVCRRLRIFYQEEQEKRWNMLLTLTEPALMILVGVFMIYIVTSVLIPLFSVYGAIG